MSDELESKPGADELESKAQKHHIARGLSENRWVRRVAQLGYGCRGFLFLIIGATWLLAAFNIGERIRGLQGAVEVVFQSPFGRFSVTILSVGIIGYIIRRFVQVFIPPYVGKRPMILLRIGRKISCAWSGIWNIGLALACLQLAIGIFDFGFVQTINFTISRIPDWLITAGILGFAGTAGFYFYMSITRRFRIDLELERVTRRFGTATQVAGSIGYAGRGLAYLVASLLLIYINENMNTVRLIGIDNTISDLEKQPVAILLLVLSAIGVIGYGIYLILASFCLRVIQTW